MRRGLQQAQHLVRERRRLRRASQKDPNNVALREQLDDCTERLFDLLVEELAFQNQDITRTQSAARRHW